MSLDAFSALGNLIMLFDEIMQDLTFKTFDSLFDDLTHFTTIIYVTLAKHERVKKE